MAESASNGGPDFLGWALLLLCVAVTVAGYFSVLSSSEQQQQVVDTVHVWYYGWFTAVSTGLGVLPFFVTDRVPKDTYMGISNALAAGMMIAASVGLMVEGLDTEYIPGFFGYKPGWRVGAGFFLGVLNIMLTEKVMSYFQLDLTAPNGQDVKKVILILFVMTLHSVSEGIGIGVSFGGRRGCVLGQFISLSLGIHNIPEGLAVALVMRSRGFSRLRTVIWCIFTSLPQPIMAVPAFLFIENFEPMLASGLGFAAGAMIYVAIFELMTEAVEQCGGVRACLIGFVAFIIMALSQDHVKGLFDVMPPSMVAEL